MSNKNYKYKTILLWGLGMYVFQKFLSDPQARIQIIFYIVISLLIYSANAFFMTNAFYNHKYLRHAVPLLIMNCVLIPVNLIHTITNAYTLTSSDILKYLSFNSLVLMIYVLQYRFYKKRINESLKTKISSID